MRREVTTVHRDTPLAEIEAALIDGQTGRLPVVDHDGVLLVHDVLHQGFGLEGF